MGTADECFGTESSCTASTPTQAGGGVELAILPQSHVGAVLGGDADTFLDNCEVLKMTIPLGNSGATTLTNVEITAASSTTHPTSVLLTSLPKPVAASLAACDGDNAVIEFQVVGLAAGQTFEVDITVDANELAIPQVVHVVSNRQLEGDFQNQPTTTWNFVANAQGWVTETGTFNRVNAGVGAPSPDAFFFQSSALLPDQCDVVRSPLVRLSATSTLSLQNHFDIEPFFAGGGVWYDRANVAFREDSNEAITVVSPSSGRAYNASGANGTCGTANQPGWAGAGMSWLPSNWTSAALQAPTLAGKPGNIVIRYGTDPGDHRNGFRFDQVTLTNFDIQVGDTQSNVCVAASLIFADSVESADTDEWSAVAP